MKKANHLLSLALAILIFHSLQAIALAQNGHFKLDNNGLGVQVASSGGAEGTVQTILVNVIALLFTVGGLGTLIYFVWGAVDWILSGGDKEKIAGARKKMTNAIIGLVLLSTSYVIINIVGNIIGFNPLGALQLPGLGYTGSRAINQ